MKKNSLSLKENMRDATSWRLQVPPWLARLRVSNRRGNTGKSAGGLKAKSSTAVETRDYQASSGPELPPTTARGSLGNPPTTEDDGYGGSISETPGEPTCQIMSDLHLEWRGYEEFNITREAPNLLLVGDIGRFRDYDRYLGFLRRQCEVFDRVMLVPGNHEFYGSSREHGLEVGLKFERELGEKFTFMQRKRIDLKGGGVIVLGCTLHSRIPENYTALTNDFARIEGWRVKNHNGEHAADVDWLQQSLAQLCNSALPSRVIIATHYAPSFEKTVHPSKEYNSLSYCFTSNMLEKFQGWHGTFLVSHWVFGHTHYNNCFSWNDLTVISNQPPGPIPDEYSGRPFNPKLVI